MDEAAALARLHARGLLSDEEYAKAAARLTVKPPPASPAQPEADPAAVLRALAVEPLMLSGEVADRVGVSIDAADEQLEWLELAGLVEYRRDGRWDANAVSPPPGVVAVVAAALGRFEHSPIDEVQLPADLLPDHHILAAVSQLLIDGSATMLIPDRDDDLTPTVRLLQGDAVEADPGTVTGRLAALAAVTDAGLVGEEHARAGRAAIRAGDDAAQAAMLLVALAQLRGSEVISGDDYVAALRILRPIWPVAAPSTARTTSQRVSVGGWGVAIFFLGFIGGAIGYFAVRSDDPRRANHIMKWGLIWTVAGWGLVYGFLGFGLILAT